jgi:hypothetical protein
MSPWLLVLLIVGLLLVVAVALSLAGVSLPPPSSPSETPEDVPTQPVDVPKEPRYQFKGLVREQAVCKALEDVYSKGFPTRRPSWLVNPATGQVMEFDCYNEELKLAAEHNGEHHYVYPNKFHKTEKEFLAQRGRDEHKRRIAEEHGVYLLTVPYWVPPEMIKDWVEYYCPERVAQRTRVENLSPPS